MPRPARGAKGQPIYSQEQIEEMEIAAKENDD
jgi:hypothetical protein